MSVLSDIFKTEERKKTNTTVTATLHPAEFEEFKSLCQLPGVLSKRRMSRALLLAGMEELKRMIELGQICPIDVNTVNKTDDNATTDACAAAVKSAKSKKSSK